MTAVSSYIEGVQQWPDIVSKKTMSVNGSKDEPFKNACAKPFFFKELLL